jgi:hypothetical protein
MQRQQTKGQAMAKAKRNAGSVIGEFHGLNDNFRTVTTRTWDRIASHSSDILVG